MKTKPIVPDHRNEAVPPCDRCGQGQGEHRWVAASRSAERVRFELRLCTGCLDKFRTFIANGKNCPVTTRKTADPRASNSPPPRLLYQTIKIPVPEPSQADMAPIRRQVRRCGP